VLFRAFLSYKISDELDLNILEGDIRITVCGMD